MATLTVSPSPAWPSAVVTVSGTGFAKGKVLILLNGVVVKTVNCSRKGTFTTTITLTATEGTQTIAASQFGAEKAMVVVDTEDVVVDPLPPPVEDPPGSDPAGWTLKHSDDFSSWVPSNYFVYPATWYDTSGKGRYDPTAISSDGTKLRVRLRTVSGVPRVAAFVPLLTGSATARGDWLGMRVSFRIRADLMVGYKGVPLLWPKEGNPWPYWGEINWPESNFNARPSAFMHRQAATVGSDQDYYPAPTGTSWQDWHEYTIEWVAGASCKFYMDGTLIGHSTNRIPAGPMHLVMQFETNLAGTAIDPAIDGYVEIDWLRVWVPA